MFLSYIADLLLVKSLLQTCGMSLCGFATGSVDFQPRKVVKLHCDLCATVLL